MLFPKRVNLVEVMPRDGLQSLDKKISTEDKVKLIDNLSETGLNKIEVTSFAHPKVVPQLSDAEQVLKKITRKEGVVYRALAPNLKGCLRALEANADEVLAVISCSEQYNIKNQNKTLHENLKEIEQMINVCRQHNTIITIALANSFYCPFEGRIPPLKVLNLLKDLLQSGASSFYLATTMGRANPREVYEIFLAIYAKYPQVDIGLHLHNQNGMALANILAALQAGVTTFEGSMLGIGGGIVSNSGLLNGNVPLEDVINLFSSMKIETGIDLKKYLEVTKLAEQIIGVESQSYIQFKKYNPPSR